MPFFPAPASTHSSAPQLFPQRDRSLVTAFPSPTTAPAFADSIEGSMVPACHFALSLPERYARSTLWLRRRNRLAPTPAVSRPQARYAPRRQLTRLLSPSPLPSRKFPSLGIKAFNRRRRRPVRLPNPPDLHSLPDARSIASLGAGSSSAVRYVSGDLLFLKPLGTSFNMPLNPFPVNEIFDCDDAFSTASFCRISNGLHALTVHLLWIKR